MERPYIEWVRIEKFRCVQEASLRLAPLHALIGPNDSGKSTVLQAIRHPSHALFWISDGKTVWGGAPGIGSGAFPSFSHAASYSDQERRQVDAATARRQLLRLDPDVLRTPTPLIPRGQVNWFGSERGHGLASLYDSLLSRDRVAFASIDERFRTLFPTVRALRLENADAQNKTMGLTLVDGTEVGPAHMSEGMLYWLAFAIIEYLAPQSILLIEEPENGLHPSRIADVMRVLREVSQRTQILVATHSPLVINELKADEVTIVTRTPEQGTICTPMAATKNFAERSKVYALGELWLSYADGEVERELVGNSTGAVKAG